MRKVLNVFLTILAIVSFSVHAEDMVKDMNYARQVRSSHNMKPQGQAVIDQYIALLEKIIEGADSEVIEAYDELYDLSHREYQTTRRSTLFREFQFDYTGIPLIICQICRDSTQIMLDDAGRIIRKQKMRSGDPRITAVFLNHIKIKESLTNAIEYCAQEVARGNKSLLIPLAKCRVEYQRELVERALNEKDIETWEPNVIEHGQLKLALSEARKAISENPNMVAEYERVFHEAFELFNTKKEAASFCEFALSQVANLRQTNAALVLRLNHRLSQYDAE